MKRAGYKLGPLPPILPEVSHAVRQHQTHRRFRSPTAEQKAFIIKEVTELLARTLGKNPATTVVIIEDVPMDNWGIGAETITVGRKKRLQAKVRQRPLFYG